MMRKILSLCALLICASCSQTVSNDRSFVDPAFRDVRFSSFVVVGQSTNLAEQEAVEYSFVKELRENGIEAYAASSIVPPTRIGRDIQADRRDYMNTGADAVIEITPSVRDLTNTRRNGNFNIGVGVGSRIDNTIFGGGYYPGGYDYEQTRADYAIEIYSLPKYNPAWRASFEINAGYSMRDDALARRMAEKCVVRLTNDGMI